MRVLRAAWRLLQAIAHALAGWRTIVFAFPKLTQRERDECVTVWSRGMLQVLGIGLQLRGTPPERGPMLLVANHISWLDILVMHAARHCRFVSKAQVRHWPLIGTLATGGGTLYIERESRRDAMRVVHRMADALRDGDILAVFPEGTTTDGLTLLPFHANLVQAAISAGAPVQPVALSFLDQASRRTSFAASYVGDETLVGSLWRTLSAPPVTAVVVFGEPQAAQGRDRRAWAADLREAVASLREMPP
ncbi:MAG TPA: lysophospholipid acyltransferase family protein [Ramlibacter sp.]|nr:lysophospholipid acyltransferase family protein [Ramlibacter sp.]